MSEESAKDEAHARVGSVLNDKWTLERLLGVGGMGAVYAGLHRNGARAAVKVLHRYLSRARDVRARFLREGYAANKVDRPGVVKVLDDDVVVGGADDGTAYLVMELLSGYSLEDRARRGPPVTEREFLAVADAVLDVLEGAHEGGVVHRDIKPENLFFARDEESGAERVKVLDFGLARLLEGRSTTSHGVAVGTPSFMAPEQAAGRHDEVDGRTDLFALAASGWKLLTGQRIHEGEGAVGRVLKMANLPAPRIRSVAPELSEPFARVIDRALEFRREDRYANAAEMRADVRKALQELGGEPEPSGAAPGGRARNPTVELSAKDFLPHDPVPAAVEAVAEPAAAPAVEPAPELAAQAGSEPAREPALEPAAQPVAELAAAPAPPPASPSPTPEPALEASLAPIPMAPSPHVPIGLALAGALVAALVYGLVRHPTPGSQPSDVSDADVAANEADNPPPAMLPGAAVAAMDASAIPSASAEADAAPPRPRRVTRPPLRPPQSPRGAPTKPRPKR